MLRPHIDAAGRLIEQQDARLCREPFADHDLLLVAAGQGANYLLNSVAADAETFNG